MNLFKYSEVDLTGGFLKQKQLLNEKITIQAVYDRFRETGRIDAFNCDWKENQPNKPHYFWDSDVAKWIEGAAYIVGKHPDKELERRIESLIDCIEKNQGEDGYFNIYYTVCEKDRFTNRNNHELYCAGHLFEAAVAYAEATGRERFLRLMEKYADYIYKVFVQDKSAGFVTPGHEEIELALVRLYRYTGRKKYIELAAFFINERGKHEEYKDFCTKEYADYNQSHIPVREQREAAGHAVRAMYLYCAMADLALELEDDELKKACLALFDDIVNRKMYVTGGIGSCYLGECFAKPYALPNDQAYAETCAGIGLMFFCLRMQRLDNRAVYADVIERVLYNGVLAALSLDGKAFFYENPLEITALKRFSSIWGSLRYPAPVRAESFECSCCPPNINRLLPVLGEYIYGYEKGVLYVNQFADSRLSGAGYKVKQKTNYPVGGRISLLVEGAEKVSVRIPCWCGSFKINQPYVMKDGYAQIINSGAEIIVELDVSPFAVQSSGYVAEDVNKLCVQAGPVIYCAEAADNGDNLHALSISPDFEYKTEYCAEYGLNIVCVKGYRRINGDKLYSRASKTESALSKTDIKLIPYYAHANRGDTDMLIWFGRKY